MNSRRWLTLTGVTVLLLVLLNFTAMWATDVFGVLRDPTGRQLPIYYADRAAKNLLSLHYVPDNYNGLLLGPSSSVNWDMPVLAEGLDIRFYNESLEGGNGTEEKLLAEHALSGAPRQGHYRLALLVLSPTMVNDATYKSGMDAVKPVEALGSLDSYVQTAVAALKAAHLGFRKLDATADGSHSMHNPRGIEVGTKVVFTVDPRATRNLVHMVTDLQARGVCVVYVIPTVFQAVKDGNASGYATFEQTMLQALPPAPVIDLLGPKYLSFRSDPANYIDGFHVSTEGGKACSRFVNERLRKILANSPDRPRS